MSELSKEQLLKSLYTIRAGLSQVSERNKTVAELNAVKETKIKNKLKTKQELDKLAPQYTEYKDKLQSLGKEEELSKKYDDVCTELENLKKLPNLSSLTKEAKRKFSFSFVIVSFLFVISLVLFTVNQEIAKYLCIISGCFFFFLLICFSYSKKKAEEKMIERKLYLEDAKMKTKFALIDIDFLKKQLQKIKEYKATLAVPLDFSAIDNELKVKTEEGIVIYGTLEEIYAPLLDTRDWGNLDLLIYYLETNRADNIKEALHCLDEQLRHTELMTLMAMATKEICSRIDTWGSRMAIQLDNIAANQRTIAAGIDASNTNLSNLLSATNMQNALLEKQNVSSRQLMDDVSALRSQADALRYKNARF